MASGMKNGKKRIIPMTENRRSPNRLMYLYMAFFGLNRNERVLIWETVILALS